MKAPRGRSLRGNDVIAEAARLRGDVHKSIAKFVETEIETGFLFCLIAKQQQLGARRERLLQNAWKAHDTAQKWIWKLHMAHDQFDQVTAQLERLGFELNGLLEMAQGNQEDDGYRSPRGHQ